jgi:two-component system, NarL family, nitrate/nitrite response regulator NarL
LQTTAQRETESDVHPAALRVTLHARDPARLGSLLAGLATEGIVADAEADLLLADIGPHEVLPDDLFASVLLTDDPLLLRDSDAAGVLPRDASPAQIAAALRAVAAGLSVRPRAQASGFAPSDDPAPPPLLTPRELEILTAVGEGLSNKAVARRLGISAHTVKFHLEAVFAKLDARTRAEAVAKGLRRGLIEA